MCCLKINSKKWYLNRYMRDALVAKGSLINMVNVLRVKNNQLSSNTNNLAYLCHYTTALFVLRKHNWILHKVMYIFKINKILK